MIFRIVLCFFMGAFSLYSYLDMQNGLTKLRLQVPELASQVKKLQEENASLLYEIASAQSPSELLKLTQRSEFSHLKYPSTNEVITLKEGGPLLSPQKEEVSSKSTTRLAAIRGEKH